MRHRSRGRELFHNHSLQNGLDAKPDSGNGLRQPIHFESRLPWLSGQWCMPGIPACARIQ